jgi:hypothetical protein
VIKIVGGDAALVDDPLKVAIVGDSHTLGGAPNELAAIVKVSAGAEPVLAVERMVLHFFASESVDEVGAESRHFRVPFWWEGGRALRPFGSGWSGSICCEDDRAFVPRVRLGGSFGEVVGVNTAQIEVAEGYVGNLAFQGVDDGGADRLAVLQVGYQVSVHFLVPSRSLSVKMLCANSDKKKSPFVNYFQLFWRREWMSS